MKIGMNVLLWTACAEYDKHAYLLDDLKEWGYDAVEFGVDGMKAKDVSRLAKKAQDIGLDCVALSAFGCQDFDPISEDKARRDKAAAHIRSCIDKAEDMGSPVLAGPVYQGLSNSTETGPTEDEWKRSVEVVRGCAEYAAGKNIKIAGEPLNRFEAWLVNSVQRAYEFAEATGMDNMGILADTHHGNIEEYNVPKAWEKVMDRIYHVHISENNRGVPGYGHAIPPEVFSTLKSGGYDGYLVIEAFNANVPEIYSMLRVWRPFVDEEAQVAAEGLKFIKQFV